MRAFHEIVFMGNGESSELLAATLVERVEVGFVLLSGIQQAQGHVDVETLLRELEDVVQDVAVALLGRSVTLGPELPASQVRNGVRVHCLGPMR